MIAKEALAKIPNIDVMHLLRFTQVCSVSIMRYEMSMIQNAQLATQLNTYIQLKNETCSSQLTTNSIDCTPQSTIELWRDLRLVAS
jgi:hypothetical protein